MSIHTENEEKIIRNILFCVKEKKKYELMSFKYQIESEQIINHRSNIIDNR